MKKAGLITLYESNYGSILQCFSTKKYIESLNGKCDVLCNVQNHKKKFLQVVNKLIYPSFFQKYFLQRRTCRVGKMILSRKSSKHMALWIEEYINPRVVSCEDLKCVDALYDYFITGSDQVWNISLFADGFNFLEFAPRQKRIALAPSFGTSEIPKYNQRALRKALAGFDYISVREETGVNIVKKYSNAKVCRIADPTFIYNADEWRGFAKDGVAILQKYILVHFLNEPNEVALESMSWLSEQLNIDIVAIGYRYDSFNRLKRFVFKDGGPWDYVSMIDKAEYVITDSFHSSLFSINFNKRFFVFHRNYLASKQTSRISDLLERFGMGNRLITDIEVLKNLYLEDLPVSSRSILERERATIRDYIQKSISGQVPQCFMTENNG